MKDDAILYRNLKRIVFVLAGIIVLLLITLFADLILLKSRSSAEMSSNVSIEIPNDNYRNYYEIYVASYYDSDGDGIGDLNGVKAKLDEIQEMGFTGIWLMPIMPSPSYHKYDVTDYCSVDPDYGTMEDFDNLAKACDERGIKLIIDFVMNHSSSLHPWFRDAREYLQHVNQITEEDIQNCPYIDYYHFYKCEGSSEWNYEADFSVDMPDLNLNNPEVRREFSQIADFWIAHGVDGFRMDAALHYEQGKEISNQQILNELYEHCLALDPNFYMVSEVWSSEKTIAQYYESKTPSFFNFPASSVEGIIEQTAMGSRSAAKYVSTILEYETNYESVYSDAIDAPFLTNHDMVRVANNLRSDENDMKMAAALLLTMKGSPFVYYGEEIGMKSKGDADENKRIPMRWSEGASTEGMCKGPQNADQNIEQSFEAYDQQKKDPDSLLNFYKKALLIRNQNPEIARGRTVVASGNWSEEQAAVVRTWNDSSVAIIYNTSDEKCTLELANTQMQEMNIRGSLSADGKNCKLKGTKLVMPGQSVCIMK